MDISYITRKEQKKAKSLESNKQSLQTNKITPIINNVNDQLKETTLYNTKTDTDVSFDEGQKQEILKGVEDLVSTNISSRQSSNAKTLKRKLLKRLKNLKKNKLEFYQQHDLDAIKTETKNIFLKNRST